MNAHDEPATPLFEANDIHKRFGHQVVLERVDLRFEANMISGIMGPNGAGKTTLFNVLTGEHRPDRGRVRFKGVDITGCRPNDLNKRGISRSFQIMTLFDEYTVLENVLVALAGVRDRRYNMFHNVALNAELEADGIRVLDRVGLAGDAHVRASSLPYGKRRALDIGVALASDPEILFLDEPTQGLGTEQVGQLAELINALRSTVTMVIIEHDMSFLFQLADTVSVVHWGQVIAHGSPHELMQNPWVSASSLGRLQEVMSDG